MPAASPILAAAASSRLSTIGASIRTRRMNLRVSAGTTAEAAGMSRVTLNRIERGEPSVTMGAYLNALAALGIAFRLVDEPVRDDLAPASSADLPAAIKLADYPQLRQLAWHMTGVDEISPTAALALYERNWRHVDAAGIEPHERQLLDLLVRTVGKGYLLV